MCLFIGTAIAIYGFLQNGATKIPSATYSVDNGTPGNSEPQQEQGTDSVLYYQSAQLAAGLHTLIINVTTAGGEFPYALDYAMYVPDSNTNTSGVSVTQTAIPNAPSASKKSVGPIVGGVVGGVAALAIIGFIVFYFMRKKKNKPYYFDRPTPEKMLGPGTPRLDAATLKDL